MVIMAIMVRVTASGGLGMDLEDPAGLGPITAGLLVGPQVAVTGGALPLQAPGQPLVSHMLRQCKMAMRLVMHKKIPFENLTANAAGNAFFVGVLSRAQSKDMPLTTTSLSPRYFKTNLKQNHSK